MMLTLCIVHSHIVSTHSGPMIGDGQSKQKIVRRLRHTRCRIGKSRTRQNLREFLLKFHNHPVNLYYILFIYIYFVCIIYFIYFIYFIGLHEDSKSSQDTASEKASTVSDEVLTSVRFAKKVVIENSLTVNRSQVIIIH